MTELTLPASEMNPGITFNVNSGTPIMEFKPNGDIFVKGKLVTNDMEVVEGMREFLKNR